MQFLPTRKARIVMHMNSQGMTYKQAVAAVNEEDKRHAQTMAVFQHKVSKLKLKEVRPGVHRLNFSDLENDPILNAMAEAMEEVEAQADAQTTRSQA